MCVCVCVFALFKIYLYSIKIKNMFVSSRLGNGRLLCTYVIIKMLFIVFSCMFIKSVQPEPPPPSIENISPHEYGMSLLR